MTRKWMPYFAPETESSGGGLRDAFRAAFEDAKTAHASGQPVVHAETDDDEDLDDDAEEAEGDEETEGDEDETPVGDPASDAPAKQVKTDTPPEKKTVPAKGKADETALITDEEFTALQAKHPNDPAALKKDLVRVFTQKTQKLADERRSVERLQQYAPLIEMMEEDLPGALAHIARQNGVDLATLAKPTAAATTTAASAETNETVEDLVTEFKAALGPELDYLGDTIAPAIKVMVEKLLAKSVGKEVEPLKKQTAAIVERAATEQTDQIMTAFEKTHPDWKDHEDAMMALAAKLDPKDMTQAEYLEHLYKVATRDAWEADREANIEREAVKRVKTRTAKLNEAESGERPAAAVPETQVRKRPQGAVTFQQAYKDAKAGIQYDDDDD